MKANELLIWLSARHEGSWQQFRAAVEELYFSENDSEMNDDQQSDENEFPLHRQLRINLECAGHVEFFLKNSDYVWRVAPPTLAIHPTSSGFRGILCGARSPTLLDRLIRTLDPQSVEVLRVGSVPDVIRITASEVAKLESMVKQSGIRFQNDTPLAILSLLPPCNPPSRQQPQSEFPEGAGWRIRKFDQNALIWRASERQNACTTRTGLFEFQLYDQWRYYLRWNGRTYKLPRAVAVYILLQQKRGFLQYDSETRTLSLPGACRPPRLIERALVLCSGLPPTFNLATSQLNYVDVPQDIARFSMGLLCQLNK